MLKKIVLTAFVAVASMASFQLGRSGGRVVTIPSEARASCQQYTEEFCATLYCYSDHMADLCCAKCQDR